MDALSVRALAFDVGGTVFDWQSPIRREVGALAQPRNVALDPARFALEWRAGMFELLAAVRNGSLPRMNSDRIHRLALDGLADRYPALALTPVERDDLALVWHRLDTWPEVPAALERLRGRHQAVVLTLLSFASVIACSRRSGLVWDGIVSCEFLTHDKPAPEAYLACARLLGLAPEEIAMVASHPADLAAARRVGFRTIFVEPRLGEPDLGFGRPSDDRFDMVAADFTSLADQLA